mmetsp:Transcript_5254/g.16377  ORF Transcript_5254/g.16377 Transcript_5254/m.16377 type:complete len:341 (-) Transcript_5254:191-1213(-)
MPRSRGTAVLRGPQSTTDGTGSHAARCFQAARNGLGGGRNVCGQARTSTTEPPADMCLKELHNLAGRGGHCKRGLCKHVHGCRACRTRAPGKHYDPSHGHVLHAIHGLPDGILESLHGTGCLLQIRFWPTHGLTETLLDRAATGKEAQNGKEDDKYHHRHHQGAGNAPIMRALPRLRCSEATPENRVPRVPQQQGNGSQPPHSRWAQVKVCTYCQPAVPGGFARQCHWLRAVNEELAGIVENQHSTADESEQAGSGEGLRADGQPQPHVCRPNDNTAVGPDKEELRREHLELVVVARDVADKSSKVSCCNSKVQQSSKTKHNARPPEFASVKYGAGASTP